MKTGRKVAGLEQATAQIYQQRGSDSTPDLKEPRPTYINEMLQPRLLPTGVEASLETSLGKNGGLEFDTIINGDCLTVVKTLPDGSIDLIFTSPPYADNRKKTYTGIPIEHYVEWFLPLSKELKRVLKPEGSFILNIKERAADGERQTYVLELILAMKKQGWLWTEEYIWHKKNCYPGKWPNRFRDAWERCLHFTNQKRFKMFQEAVVVPMGKWKEKRLAKLSDIDRIRDESHVGSGFGKNISHWLGREYAYPTNVLHFATECSNRGHSASFPISLPTWFIKLLTKEEDVVLDPFIGSGTTAVACIRLGRHYIGIEATKGYYDLAIEAVEKAKNEHRRARVPDKQVSTGLL